MSRVDFWRVFSGAGHLRRRSARAAFFRILSAMNATNDPEDALAFCAELIPLDDRGRAGPH